MKLFCKYLDIECGITDASFVKDQHIRDYILYLQERGEYTDRIKQHLVRTAMKDNNYSMVEGILYNDLKLKVEIDNLKIDPEEAQEIVGIKGSSGNEKAGSSTNAFSSLGVNLCKSIELTENKMYSISYI